ncbi:hypothetical protein Q5P01_002737 [Channa striata]|uniref:Uncharacterized protein n=1 Tax=Channa striata TaxID=64152 RepID=A0AA88NS55_CHASR|nr:hypothetical protein Q5P01_002737 [Channa striata]
MYDEKHPQRSQPNEPHFARHTIVSVCASGSTGTSESREPRSSAFDPRPKVRFRIRQMDAKRVETVSARVDAAVSSPVSLQPCVHQARGASGGRTCSTFVKTTASPKKSCSTAALCGASSPGPHQTPKVLKKIKNSL